MSKYYNVVCRKVVSNDLTDKKIYHKVGVLKVTQNGGWFLQMYHQPNTEYLVFPNQDDKLPVINFETDNA